MGVLGERFCFGRTPRMRLRCARQEHHMLSRSRKSIRHFAPKPEGFGTFELDSKLVRRRHSEEYETLQRY